MKYHKKIEICTLQLSSVPSMLPATNTKCARCLAKQTDFDSLKASYAFMLLHETHDIKSIFEQSLDDVKTDFLPPLHTYCIQCHQVCWVARHACIQEALNEHTLARKLWKQLWNQL